MYYIISRITATINNRVNSVNKKKEMFPIIGDETAMSQKWIFANNNNDDKYVNVFLKKCVHVLVLR